jgi:hypothetical protein
MIVRVVQVIKRAKPMRSFLQIYCRLRETK